MRPHLRVVSDDAPRVSQADLVRLQNKRRDLAALSLECDRLELALISRLDAGERVEPGTLHAQIIRTVSCVVTEDDVRRLLGLEVLEELRAHVDPVVSRSLHVHTTAIPRQCTAT